jgi:hypothetical protein
LLIFLGDYNLDISEASMSYMAGNDLMINLPSSWTCGIHRGASGMSIEFSPTSWATRTGFIKVGTYASMTDNTFSFCGFWKFAVSQNGSTIGRNCLSSEQAAVKGSKAIYIYGNYSSSSVAIIVQTPKGIKTPDGTIAKAPTTTLIASGASGQIGVDAMSCQIGNTFSQICYSDMLGFAQWLFQQSRYS